jgi:hypothetical protein
MPEDFDPGFSLDVSSEAEFGLDVVERDAAGFLAQRLDFEHGKGMSGRFHDFVELGV